MMQAIEERPCLPLGIPLVPYFIHPCFDTMEYCYPGIPFPMLDLPAPRVVVYPVNKVWNDHPAPGPVIHPVKEVWKKDLEEVFKHIWDLISHGGCWCASIDTEFPGTIFESDKGRIHDPEYNYKMMKMNVNATKIIQLGLTLEDLQKKVIYTWEFNFSDFDIDRDPQNEESIQFLKRQGIDFWKNKVDGISSQDFAKKCKEVGLFGNRLVELKWVGFQISYDLGYFTKILTGERLPDDFGTYKKKLLFYFGKYVSDVKKMMADWFPTFHGGLNKLAETMGITRVHGKSHQAGSDSLLTYLTFRELELELARQKELELARQYV